MSGFVAVVFRGLVKKPAPFGRVTGRNACPPVEIQWDRHSCLSAVAQRPRFFNSPHRPRPHKITFTHRGQRVSQPGEGPISRYCGNLCGRYHALVTDRLFTSIKNIPAPASPPEQVYAFFPSLENRT